MALRIVGLEQLTIAHKMIGEAPTVSTTRTVSVLWWGKLLLSSGNLTPYS